MDKISVIIPIYNVEKYLEQCISSVLNQTYKNFEVICVNDGATDKSGEIIEAAAKNDERIKIINQKNQGLSGARNTGFKYVTGDWIVLLDSDDWIDENTFEAALKNVKEENADVVLWSYVREFPNASIPKNIFNKEKIVFNNDDVRKVLHRRFAGLINEELSSPEQADSVVTAWGKLYKAEVILNNNVEFVDTKIIGTEDALFNLTAFCYVNKAVYINKHFNHYRKDNAKSLTKKYKPELFSQWQTLYSMMENVIIKNNLGDEYFYALQNRRALSILGLGFNELCDTSSALTKIKRIKKYISSEKYSLAYSKLKMNYFPVKWKMFFKFCKNKNAAGIYFLLKIMNEIIDKRRVK